MELPGVLRHLRRGGRPDDLLDVVRRLLREERLDDLLALLAALDEDARARLRAWWREDAREALRARRRRGGRGGTVPRADALLAAACAEDGAELLTALFPTPRDDPDEPWEDRSEIEPLRLSDPVRADVVHLVTSRGEPLGRSVEVAARAACAASARIATANLGPFDYARLLDPPAPDPASLPGDGADGALRVVVDLCGSSGRPFVVDEGAAVVLTGRAWTAGLQRARAAVEPGAPVMLVPRARRHDGSSLAAVLQQVPRPADLLAAVCRSTAAVRSLDSAAAFPGHDVRAAVRLVVSADDAPRLARVVLGVLDGAPTPRDQQVLADVLAGLALPASWVLEEADHLLGLLPVLNRTSAVVVAGLLLDAAPPSTLLAEVGAVVLSRGEKASHRRLVDVLLRRVEAVTSTPPGPEGEREALLELLGAVADGEDLRLAGRSATALKRLGADPAGSEPAGVPDDPGGVRWAVPLQEAPDPPPFVRAEASPDGLDSLTTPGRENWLVPRGAFLDDDRWLDAGVRLAATDPRALALWSVSSLPVRSPADRPARALRAWGRASGLVPLPPGEVVDSPPSPPGWSITSFLGADGRWHEERRVLEESRDTVSGPQVPRAALADEVRRLHLGVSPELLSTPSTQDGQVRLDDLVARMRRVPGYGPVDLLVALLRLDPCYLDRGRQAPPLELRLPPLPGAPGPLPDGGEALRRWVAAGGLPERRTLLREGRLVQEPALAPGVLPVQELLLREVLEEPAHWSSSPFATLALLPTWVEAAAVSHISGGVDQSGPLPRLVAGPGRPGLAVHHRVVELLAHERVDARSVGAEALLTMARRGVLDPTVLTSSALLLLDEGHLPLARTAAACETVAITGGLAPVWPVLAALVDRVADALRLPTGSADLLRVVRGLAPTALDHLGPAALPASLERLADRRGSSRAVLEARELARLRRAAAAGGTAG